MTLVDAAKKLLLSIPVSTRLKHSLLSMDANPYLDLYRITKGQRLIEALTEQKDFLL